MDVIMTEQEILDIVESFDYNEEKHNKALQERAEVYDEFFEEKC